MPSRKQLIIYDLDGTLVDTREDIARAANHMLSQMALPELPAGEIAGYVGRGVFALISNCLKSTDPKKVEKATRIYRDHYAKHMLDHSRVYPGAVETLDYFKDRHQMVLTNKPNPYSFDLLKALGVGDYFFDVVAGDEVYPKKPDPAAVFAMLKKFNLTPEQALFIGDSLVDIETARHAKIEVVVLTHGFSGLNELQSASPEGIAANFPELLDFIKKKAW